VSRRISLLQPVSAFDWLAYREILKDISTYLNPNMRSFSSIMFPRREEYFCLSDAKALMVR
jgi:hypothetical protein